MSAYKQACLFGAVLSVALMAGCSKNETEVSNGTLSGTAESAGQTEQKMTAKQSQVDASVPISQYVMITPDEDPIILTKFLIAKSGNLFSEDEALRLLSAQYYNERDAFKKKDIAKALMPSLNDELKAMAGTSYLAIPIELVPYGQKGRSAFNIDPLSVQTYNFDLGGFPLLAKYGAKDCWSSSFSNTQNVSVSVTGPDAPCFLPVKDETAARAIENAIQSSDLEFRGTAYVQLTARKRSLYGQVVHAKIELTHRVTKENLGTFDL